MYLLRKYVHVTMIHYFPSYNANCYSSFVYVHVASNRSNPFFHFDDGSATTESKERSNAKSKSVEGSQSRPLVAFV